ncbi:MAG: class I SAM-dependent methyltransferase [Thermoplasmata archaeon]|nr:class I SAM-dependent methyltransferase [Thermoplasmata archaeon]
MKEGRPSVTASRVAMLRAAHQLFDEPRVFDDPLAVSILGPIDSERVERSIFLARNASLAGLRAWIVARSRYAEEELAKARDRGVAQYVVLGAGLDTFAYRNKEDSRPLEVFEVDHPATQAWKRTRLQEASIPIPPSVHFVATNFESGRLVPDLIAGGFRPEEPAFFGWLGVTMYLTRPAIDATLDVLAATPASSGLVLDYFDRTALTPPVQRVARGIMAARVALSGEPFLSGFDGGELPNSLRARGFRNIEDIGAVEANARYFAGRADGLRVVSPVGRVLSAVR